MTTLGKAVLETAVDQSGLKTGLSQSEAQTRGAFTRMGDTAKNVLAGGIKVAIAAVTTLALASAAAVGMGSDLNETINKTNVIFGSASETIVDFSEGAAGALGQTQQGALDAVTTFGVFGKAAGLAGEDLSGFAIDLTSLASDLASFHNTSPEEAVLALGAALRGESEPIRRYGVLLNEATLKQVALKHGIIETTSQALTPAQKTMAAYFAILEQTGDAQGDFARTSEGMANQQRILKAELTDLATEWGSALLPVVEQFVREAGPTLISTLQMLTDENLPAFITLVDKMAEGILKAVDAASLLVTWNIQIDNALAEQQQNLLMTADGYAAYAQGTIQAAQAAGDLTTRQAELLNMMLAGGSAWDEMVASTNGRIIPTVQALASDIGLLTEEERTQAQQVASLEAAYAAAGVTAYEWNKTATTSLELTEGLATETTTFTDQVARLRDRQKDLLEAMRASIPTIEEMLGYLQQDVSSPLSAFIADLRFFIASGGQDFATAFAAIKSALAQGSITAAEALGFSGELLASIERVKVAAGEITFNEAAQNLMDTLGVSLAEAKGLLDEVRTSAEILNDVQSTVSVRADAVDVDAVLAEVEGLHEATEALPDNVTVVFAAEGTDAALEAVETLDGGLHGVGAAAAQAASKVQTLINKVVALGAKTPDAYIPSSPPPFAQGLMMVGEAATGAREPVDELGKATRKAGEAAEETRRKLDELHGRAEILAAGFLQNASDRVAAERAEMLAELEGLQHDLAEALLEGDAEAVARLQTMLDTLQEQLANFDGTLNLQITGNILETARSLSRASGTFADIFENRTLDPMRDQLAALDEQIANAPDWYALTSLTAQRAELTARIAAEEQRIYDLQQKQQELDFLQAQLDLLNLAQSAGLDTSIFEGMLGLGADPAALTDLMDEVIQALIDQANASLQTGSPSKVFREIGQTIPGGLEQALSAGATDVADATRRMMAAAVDVADSTVTPAATAPIPIFRNLPQTKGGDQLVFNFPNLRNGNPEEIKKAVKEALREAGYETDIIRRMR